MSDTFRRPLDQLYVCRRDRRHLINRRDTLVSEIVRAARFGNVDRVPFLRDEANRVNEMIASLVSQEKELTRRAN
jgi:hypothetical protein